MLIILGIQVLATFTLPNVAVAKGEWKICKLSFQDSVYKILYKIMTGDIKIVQIDPDVTSMAMDSI